MVPTAMAATAPRPVPVYSEVKDWLVACDNGRACEAKGFTDDQPDVWMTVERAAGPTGALTVEIDAQGAIDAKSVSLDDKPVDLAGGNVNLDESDGAKDASVHFTGAPAYKFLRDIRNGKIIALDPVKTETRRAVSLDGLAAVLLLMDDVQGRIGTETALARPGPAAAATVPPAPALPKSPSTPPDPGKLSDANAKALIAAIRGNAPLMKPAECEDNTEGADGSDDEADLLTPDVALVLVGCLHGAYQSSAVAFIAPVAHPDQARRLTLAVPGAKDPVDLFTSADYDAPTHMLSTSAKGRGIADCGQAASWVFDGKQFQLVALASQDRCGGAPGDWPTLWRVAEAPKP